MSVTLKQVAEKAKVSISTVSRVINNIPTIHPKTRERVLEVAREMNYSPNRIAKSLVEGKSYTIEMILPSFAPDSSPDSEYFYKLITGILSTTQAKYYNLLIKPRMITEDPSKNWFDFPADGYIVAIPVIEEFVLKHLQLLRKPAVIINGRSHDYNWVDLDNTAAGFKATEHLINLGHRRILFLGGMLENRNTIDRLEGYKQALFRHGLSFDQNLAGYANFNKSDAFKEVSAKLESGLDFSSVFAANDIMAYGAIEAARVRGLKVPDDIAVVGFDDISTSEHFNPALTTVRQPFVEEGRKAAELLIQQIEKKTQNTQGIEMAGELIIRKSCGADK